MSVESVLQETSFIPSENGANTPGPFIALAYAEPDAEILIVDDDVQMRDFIRVGFQMANLMVREANTVEEGIWLAALPDLVPMDPTLPDIDGSEILRRLRS